MKQHVHLSEEELVLAHYGELREATLSEARECPDCQKQLSELGGFLATVAPATAPERGEEYGTQLWNAIRARLPKKEQRRGNWFPSAQAWAMGTALGAVIVAAFLLGRYYSRQPQGRATTAAVSNQMPTVKERVLLVAVGEHLERSQMVLLELMNAPDEKTVDISSEQRRAEDLVNANRLYRQVAEQNGDARIADVLDDLERVLLEVAHSPSEITDADLAQLRKQIESKGLLFKVKVLQSNVKHRNSPQARRATPAQNGAKQKI